MTRSLDDFATAKLAALEAGSLRRRVRQVARGVGAVAVRDGVGLISFSCNDYLNLSQHPAVIEAAVAATRRYGVGAGASRLVTGDHPLYRGLEARLAALKGTADAVVFGSGYLANIGIIPALVGAGDAVFVDELAHACIWAGARLSGAAVVRFGHNDVGDLRRVMAGCGFRRAIVATDGVFSMDGDVAPIDALAVVAAEAGAWLMSDDAHGIGVLDGGRGSPHDGVSLRMGTLSKAVGGYGGYLCASVPVCELIRNRARSFVYTTGLPPGVVAAAAAALDVMAGDAELCARPVRLARMFTGAVGLPEAASPIVPLVLGGAEAALAGQAELEAAGFLVAAIRPPTVPEGTARLRFAFSAAHREADVMRLAEVVRERVMGVA
ncbi:aminotransferase class I/II-fold pyridoxal phosphate-dependent enzyme [Acidiphilium acidophilum]|uniref:Aminotransferase class I/II-fold pyridoxal phosphate-dependent enzyme n=1 Tax=Acidiphilium acidophilum TaxID=76588 RepID=A0AAW9DU31_ACIAO|nr:aminotransferase class I/II-fold pyridoxal phosphate-dependent enzyme [Acidiphilium acidophilum]MDX5932147.1 aminotransferase class I/II-fold pyridoxal phosphate-dependent enzyme [Acidiphilium acidophilum]